MSRFSLKSVLFVVIVAVALPLAAQEKSGTVAGVVFDGDGVPLPGATVSVTGENMMGARNTITDAGGVFRFMSIPPGSYTVAASLAGFQSVKQDNVPVSLGKTAHLDMTLKSGFGDTIEVTSETMLIDTTSSKVGANVTSEMLSAMPTDRQYQYVMALLPGAVEANNPMMHGASGSDNMYMVDGASTTDPLTNTWSTAINFDNIQEVQVTTGGISAEYGRGTGAVVNMLTKSGSNQFHGMVRAHVTDTEWNSEAKGDRFYFSDSTRYITEDRWSFNLGGPIVRDNLWFFVSWEDRGKTKPTSVFQTPDDFMNAGDTGDSASYITHGDTPYEGHYGQAKLTWSPNSSNTFMAQYMDDPIDIPNLYSYLGYNSRGEGSDVLREQGGYNVIATWTGILSDNAFLDAKFNMKRNSLNNIPTGEGITYYMTNSAGYLYWNNASSLYLTDRDHDNFAVTWTQFVNDLAGDHNFKFGIDYIAIQNTRTSNNYPGGEFFRYLSDGETPYYHRVVTQWHGETVTDETNWALYAQDSWQVTSNLTLNLGLRLETLVEKTPQGGFTGLDWGIGDRIAPRLGFAYAIGSKGESNLHGSYGRYHDTIGNYVTRTFADVPSYDYTFQYWSGDLGDWDPDRTYYYSIGGASASTFPLDSPYMDEFTLGYEGRLTDTMAWSVDGIWRTWKKGIEDDDGQWFDEFPDNPPDDGNYVFMNLGTYREYKGIEFTLRKRLGADKFQFIASYTYSDTESLWGNSDYATVYADNPFNYYNWNGRPEYDHRHMAKFNGSYFLPLGFMVGTNFTYWSGMPYTIYADAQTSDNSEWGARTFGNYYPEQRGSRELDATYRWDLRLEWNVGIGRGMNIGLYVDIFNVTNTQPIRDTNNFYGTLLIDEPGQTVDNLGNPIDTSTFEPAANEWQAPRSYFFGAKFEF